MTRSLLLSCRHGPSQPRAGLEAGGPSTCGGQHGDSRRSLGLSDPVPLGLKTLEVDEIPREGQQEKRRTRRTLEREGTRPMSREGGWALRPSSIHVSNEEEARC